MIASIIQSKPTCGGRGHVPGSLSGGFISRPNSEPPTARVAHFASNLHLAKTLPHGRFGDLLATLSASGNNVGRNDARITCIIQNFADKCWHDPVTAPPSLWRALGSRNTSKCITALWRAGCGRHDVINCGIPAALKCILFHVLDESHKLFHLGVFRHLALHDRLIGENEHYGDIGA